MAAASDSADRGPTRRVSHASARSVPAAPCCPRVAHARVVVLMLLGAAVGVAEAAVRVLVGGEPAEPAAHEFLVSAREGQRGHRGGGREGARRQFALPVAGRRAGREQPLAQGRGGPWRGGRAGCTQRRCRVHRRSRSRGTPCRSRRAELADGEERVPGGLGVGFIVGPGAAERPAAHAWPRRPMAGRAYRVDSVSGSSSVQVARNALASSSVRVPRNALPLTPG